MSTEKNRRKIKRLKGSVLFTTLVVMVLILLIMLAAIGLAGAASKKAYSTWYDNQTKYTAQDLVDNVIQTLGEHQPNQTLGSSIVTTLRNGGKGTKVDVDVNLHGGNSTIPGYGTVESLTFEHAGINGTSFRLSNDHEKDIIIKVSAAVRMGGETSTYSTYCIGNGGSNKTNANGGGYIALADLKGGSGSNDAPGTIGRFYAGIDKKITETAGGNQTVNAGDVFINADKYTFNAKCDKPAGIIVGRNDPMNGYYGGMRVTGDMVIQNGLLIQSQYPPEGLNDLSGEKFYNIPYLYVDGQLQTNTQGISLIPYKRNGADTIGMLNIYCDTIAVMPGGDFSKLVESNGNINYMLMGENKTNTFKMDASTLTDWAKQTVTGITNKGNMHSGNLYCKGTLNLTGTGKTFEVNGDLLVVGDLKTSGTINVHNGNVYVGGSITGTVNVDTGYDKEADLGASGSSSTFLTKVRDLDSTAHPNAVGAAGRFEEAFTLKDGDTSLVQTLEQIKDQFVDADSKYIGVVDKSDYADNIEWDGIPVASGPNAGKYVIENSCVWKSTTKMKKLKSDGSVEKDCGIDTNSGEFSTIYINPHDKDIWINIDSSLTSINGKEIIIDDSEGGSVKFFIEKGAAGRTITLPMTKIITKTYYDMFYGGGTIPALSSYPESKYVPHVYIYAAPDNDVTIEAQSGNYMFTCDIIAPKATFKARSNNGNKQTIDYTYYNYIDTNGDKKVDASDLTNPVKQNREINNLAFLGSLETGCIDVTNEFGYLYVDDPPFDGKDKALADGFSWTNIDGYSTY